jgi:SAM-dependent methyltransferase
MDNAGLSEGMRRYWDDRARENAVFYVDTSCGYDDQDIERFFRTGVDVVRQGLVEAPVRPVGRALAVELGPGLGRICKALSPHFDRVLGVDVSTEMVSRARDLVSEENVSFEVGDGVTLHPVADGAADFVLTFTVLQHLPSREAVVGYLREAARVLAPGGVLAAQWNGDAHPHRFRLRTWKWKLEQRLGSRRHRNRLAPQFLGTPVPVGVVREALEASGLVVEATRGEGTLYAWVWARRPTM